MFNFKWQETSKGIRYERLNAAANKDTGSFNVMQGSNINQTGN